MLNSADSNSFFDLVSGYLKAFDHLTWNFYYFGGIQVLNSDFLKFRILEILNFHSCKLHNYINKLSCWYIEQRNILSGPLV